MRGALLAWLMLAVGARFAPAANWPLTGSLGAHDPTIIKEGGTWWCFTTGAGLPVKFSVDGLQWTQGVRLFDVELPWWRTYAPAMGQLDVWAPDIHKFGDRYWCYYSVSEFGRNNSAIGLKSCTSIARGDWRDDGFVIGSRSGADTFNAIDPQLTTDAQCAPWLAFGSWFSGIQIVALDPATMKPAGPVQTIARKPNGIEGPNVIHAHGSYYLFVSIDTCCQGVNSTYKIACGRAPDITGPYLDRSGVPLLNAGGTLLESSEGRWIGPGGQDVYVHDGRWVIARHAYDATRNGAPTLRIADLYWDTNGWPTLNATDAAPPPVLVEEPVSQTVAPGGTATFRATATGAGLAYQWLKDGAEVAGATEALLTLRNVQAADNGRYAVRLTGLGGQVVSAAANLLVATPRPGRLLNLSVRSRAGAGSDTLIAGFVIAGPGRKAVLVRGVGATLASFGVAGALADPALELFHGAVRLAENDSWARAPNLAAITAAGGHLLGAGALSAQDAVILESLAASAYTAQVKSAGDTAGIALLEVYDRDAGEPGAPGFEAQPRLVNLSARAPVGTGDAVLIAGFVLNGNVPRRVLLRGAGATLARFGVPGVLADPLLELHDASGLVAESDNWAAQPGRAAVAAAGGDRLGEFPLQEPDAALVVTLGPGAYTAVLRGVSGGTGVALLEVFELP